MHKTTVLTAIDISTPLNELQDYLRGREWLNPEEDILSVEKPGEGNMNVVLRVTTNERTFILKQSRPYVQKYPDIKAPLDRIAVEKNFYQSVRDNAVNVHIPWTISGTSPELFIYFTMFFVGVAAYISYRTQNSRIGRAWAAMREDEDVAEAIGISTIQAKLLAFITGAVIASFAGALFSAKVGTVFTNSFDVLVSIIILVVVIVGGMGSIRGVIVGAIVLIGILGGPKSQGLLTEFAQYKLLFYGAILVFMMLKRPEGLFPSVRRSRELHGAEAEQDAWLHKLTEPDEDEVTV